VCPSCVLFGTHLKHDILELKAGVDYLRESISEEQSKGTLKKEFTESNLLDIREYSLRLEKYKNDTIKFINECFKNLITILKKRKNDKINEAIDKFNFEKESIINEENRWIEKQEISEKILSLMADKDETNLLLNSKVVLEGIRKLNEELTYKTSKIYNNIESSVVLENGKSSLTLNYDELKKYLSKYITICDPNILEYKA
jgi:hypothetical protein